MPDAPAAAAPVARRPRTPVKAHGAVKAEARPRQVGDWLRVADALQTEIVTGRIHPREHLVEDELILRLGTSRHAVRAAFEELQRRGLLERERNRGARVRGYSARDVEELFEIQMTLEARAIERMPLPLPATEIDRLEQLRAAHEAASRADDLLAINRCNRAFHDALFRLCGNVRLAEAIATYALSIDPIRMRRLPDIAWRKQALAHHRAMVGALRKADRPLLLALCREHLEPTRDFYVAHFAST